MDHSFVPPPIPPKDETFAPPPPPQKDQTGAAPVQKPKGKKPKWAIPAAICMALALCAAAIYLYINDTGKNVLIIEDRDGIGPVVVGYEKLESDRLVIPKNVVVIGAHAFQECENLTSVTIPGNVKRMGDGAFAGCTNLKKVTIKNGVTEIGPSAFSGCTGLTSIEIPDSVTRIGWGAFFGCTGLTSIKIPDSVTEIRAWAFSECTGLTSIKIPDSVTEIGAGAFSGCTGLTSIEIPDSVIIVWQGAFAGCNSLNKVTLPEKFRARADEIFSNCDSIHLDFYGGQSSDSDSMEKAVLNWAFTENAPDVDIVSHYAEEWGSPVSFTVYVESGTVKDFCIVSFDPRGESGYEVYEVLSIVGDLTAGQGVVMKVNPRAIRPGTGFAFREPDGTAHVYTVWGEFDEDGSIISPHLSQDWIKQEY